MLRLPVRYLVPGAAVAIGGTKRLLVAKFGYQVRTNWSEQIICRFNFLHSGS